MRRRQKLENFNINQSFVITHQWILNLTAFHNLIAVNVYVGFRSQIPDKETEKRVMEYLKENNIDTNQLVEWKVDNCQ